MIRWREYCVAEENISDELQECEMSKMFSYRWARKHWTDSVIVTCQSRNMRFRPDVPHLYMKVSKSDKS